MSKKKQKKKKKGGQSISILQEMDRNMDTTYKNLLQEIEDYQMEIYIADRKARKKERKRLKKDPYYFVNNKERIYQRSKVVKEMEGKNFFDRIEKALKEFAPIIVLISRLVAGLILSILSLEPVKRTIQPKTLNRMKSIYELSTSIK